MKANTQARAIIQEIRLQMKAYKATSILAEAQGQPDIVYKYAGYADILSQMLYVIRTDLNIDGGQ